MGEGLLALVLAWRFVAVAASVMVTVVHALDEVFGDGAPLWDEFGRIAGVRVPWVAGFVGVAVLLPGGLIVAAIQGYGWESETALSILVGIRFGDALFSHWWLWLAGLSRPNPGLWSSVPGLIEGGLIVSQFTVDARIAVAAGLLFALVIPGLTLAGRVGLLSQGGR